MGTWDKSGRVQEDGFSANSEVVVGFLSSLVTGLIVSMTTVWDRGPTRRNLTNSSLKLATVTFDPCDSSPFSSRLSRQPPVNISTATVSSLITSS